MIRVECVFPLYTFGNLYVLNTKTHGHIERQTRETRFKKKGRGEHVAPLSAT
jgi:hypothetical protein